MNTITGAVDIIPKRILDGYIANPEKEVLEKRGYFSETDNAINRKKLAEVNQEHNKSIPYWFYILTNLKCNFACPICYERQILDNVEISRPVLNETINCIKKIQQDSGISADRINLVIFGGEPLLVYDKSILRRIFESAYNNCWKCVIVTNGSLVPKFMKIFDEFRSCISDFRITLDGPSKIHNSRRPYRGGKKSFSNIVSAIDSLLKNNFQVKMQTIVGAGNIEYLDKLASFVESTKWLNMTNFQWRIEGSHDYANLDYQKDEISEAIMAKSVIDLLENRSRLQAKLKFESFKYLAHLTQSFGWMGQYKTYWGPKFGFCEPQKGFHYVFSPDGKIYHCPRTIGNVDFCVGETKSGFSDKELELKHKTILDKENCKFCDVSSLCGGGCVVQKNYYPEMDCRALVLSIISEFVRLMQDKILERTVPNQIVSVNDLWF